MEYDEQKLIFRHSNSNSNGASLYAFAKYTNKHYNKCYCWIYKKLMFFFSVFSKFCFWDFLRNDDFDTGFMPVSYVHFPFQGKCVHICENLNVFIFHPGCTYQVSSARIVLFAFLSIFFFCSFFFKNLSLSVHIMCLNICGGMLILL